MKRWLSRLAALLAILGVGGFLIIVSGLVPIKASSGHWAITEMFLDFTKRRSVATHSIGIEAPPLDNPAMVLKGAGHFENGCGPCHGRPGEPAPRIPQAMTPAAPPLASRIGRWSPAELFHIVKHGIKFTGMPAWPAPQRDDEVWAMVAFLRVLPELDGAGYRRLVNGAASAIPTAPVPAAVTGSCSRCHGLDGLGREGGAFPGLAGQSETYLSSALRAFAGGARHSGIMEPIAAGLDDQTMRDLARYYAGLAPRRAGPFGPAGTSAERAAGLAGTAGQDARGAEIAGRGIPARKVPSCSDCHGPAKTDRNPAYPVLAGQLPEYLVLQLGLFARGARGGSAYSHLMPPVAAALTAEEMAAVARYYASLSPNP